MQQFFDSETALRCWKTYWKAASSEWFAEHQKIAPDSERSVMQDWLNENIPDLDCQDGRYQANLFRKAAQSLLLGDVIATKLILSELLKLDHKCFPALWLSGVCSSSPAEAIDLFSQALRLNLDIGYFYHGRGFALLQLHELNQALLDFEQAIALEPLSPWSYLGKSEVLYQQTKYDQALKVLKQLENLDICLDSTPAWRHLRLNFARVYFHQLMYFRALQSLKPLLDKYPHHLKGLYWKAYCQIYNGEVANGIETIDLYLKLETIQSLYLEMITLKAFGYQCLVRFEDMVATLEPLREQIGGFGQQMLVYAYIRLDKLDQVISYLPSIKAPSDGLIDILEQYLQGLAIAHQYNDLTAIGEFLELHSKPSFERNHSLGNAYLALDQNSKALSHFQKAAALNIEHFEVRLKVADLLIEGEQYTKALETIEGTQHTENLPAEVYAKSAQISLLLKDIDKAIHYLRRAIAKNPNQNSLARELAQALLSKYYANPTALINDLQYGEKRNYTLMIWLGDGFQSRGMPEIALKYYDYAANIRPDLAETFLWRSSVYMSLNDYNSCEADLEKALSIDPDYAEAYSQRAALQLNRGFADEKVAEDLQKALSLNPDSVQAIGALGVFYLRQHNHREALALLQKALAIAPETAWLNAYAAQAYHEIDEPVEALKAAEKCLTLNPSFEGAEFNYIYASLLADHADHQEALLYIRKNLTADNSLQDQSLHQKSLALCEKIEAEMNVRIG
ncbi:MAG: tetratricopeptide repeat protein [Candidatus Caenarcaniphilales bacterium]|nr:tetratricopeptide repeat protein [Candidatus Caenarcaniphilales bacterium]